MSNPLQQVLIITYYWPPSGGAGVQRWLKFVKYLPVFGWQPVVLTVDPEFATYPVKDDSLLKDVGPDVEVLRTRSKEYFSIYQKITGKKQVPFGGFANEDKLTFTQKISRFVRGNFFIPDPRKGWNNYALKKASDIIQERNIKYVITSSPPHSTQLIGEELKQKFDIKWIADFRDPWTDISYYNMFYPTTFARNLDKKLEQIVLQKADRIITVSPFLHQLFSEKIKGSPEKITTIYNGFDEEDFNSLPTKTSAEFTITYVGTLSEAYPVQTFAETLNALNSENVKINLLFVGKVAPEQMRLLKEHLPGENIEFIDYLLHDEAVRYMTVSSALLLIIPEDPQNKGIITGKIFEYLAAKKPILLIGPEDGDAANIIRETSSGVVVNYNNRQKMKDKIMLLYEASQKGEGIQVGKNIEQYSRKSLTRNLSDLLNELL